MDRQDEMEFDLNEIMREFSSQAPPAPLTGQREPQPVPLEDPVTELGEPEIFEQPKEADPLDMGDTIRLDAIRKAVATASAPDAVRLTEEEGLEATVAFQPIQTDDLDPQAQEQSVPEPFDQDWEPDFEANDEDFQIPEPVIHRPKSRLRELRHKLVDGPEQRYYALSEKGVGKTQAALILNILLMLLSVGFTTVCTMNGLPADQLRLVVFVQFLTMLLSALLGCYRLIDGVTDMIRLRFTPDSLLVLTFLVSCVDGVIS